MGSTLVGLWSDEFYEDGDHRYLQGQPTFAPTSAPTSALDDITTPSPIMVVDTDSPTSAPLGAVSDAPTGPPTVPPAGKRCLT